MQTLVVSEYHSRAIDSLYRHQQPNNTVYIPQSDLNITNQHSYKIT